MICGYSYLALTDGKIATWVRRGILGWGKLMTNYEEIRSLKSTKTLEIHIQ